MAIEKAKHLEEDLRWGINFNIDITWTQGKVNVKNLKKLPKKIKIFKTFNTQHTFWSCLIRYMKMKWIHQVLWKLQSGHDSVHRWKNGWMDNMKPVYSPFSFVEAQGTTSFYDVL